MGATSIGLRIIDVCFLVATALPLLMVCTVSDRLILQPSAELNSVVFGRRLAVLENKNLLECCERTGCIALLSAGFVPVCCFGLSSCLNEKQPNR